MTAVDIFFFNEYFFILKLFITSMQKKIVSFLCSRNSFIFSNVLKISKLKKNYIIANFNLFTINEMVKLKIKVNLKIYQ